MGYEQIRSPRLRVREEVTKPVTLTMMVHREFNVDDSVMSDSLRLMPVSRAQMKRWTKIRTGVAVLQPGTRRKDELHTQDLDLRSLEKCGGNVLLNNPDALVGPIFFAIDEKLIVTFGLFRRI